MGESVKEFVAGAVALIAVVLVIICAIAVPAFYSDTYECEQITVNTGTETKFAKNHILSWDCYVSVDGKWIPADKWRGDEE